MGEGRAAAEGLRTDFGQVRSCCGVVRGLSPDRVKQGEDPTGEIRAGQGKVASIYPAIK